MQPLTLLMPGHLSHVQGILLLCMGQIMTSCAFTQGAPAASPHARGAQPPCQGAASRVPHVQVPVARPAGQVLEAGRRAVRCRRGAGAGCGVLCDACAGTGGGLGGRSPRRSMGFWEAGSTE